MSTMTISVLIGLAVISLIGGIGLVLSKSLGTVAEERLDGLSGKRKPTRDPIAGMPLKAQAINPEKSGGWAKILPSAEGLNRLYEQADVGLEFNHFMMIVMGLALAGAGVCAVLRLNPMMLPVAAAAMGATPFLWLVRRKKKRIKAFTDQMPDALDLVARALRAGHGMASGLSVVAEEMPPPIAAEFGRVFEEQNFGIPLEESLRGLTDRVPSMDVRFFVMAVVIQRATGGDLAEILDKIGRIIRERFQILGQVRSLTAEGRLSGIFLMALPPIMLAFTYVTNRDYASLMFTTPVGTKMLAIAAVLQVIGAFAIKKITTIKV